MTRGCGERPVSAGWLMESLHRATFARTSRLTPTARLSLVPKLCFLALLIVTALVAGSTPVNADAANEPVMAPRPPRLAGIEGDAQDLVYASKRGPVLIRMHIQIDGRGFRSLQDDFSTGLFHRLDADKNGTLDEKEAKEIPPPTQLTAVGENGSLFFQPIDRSPKDGNVSLEELKQFVRDVGSKPFEVFNGAAKPDRPADLFAKLDLNGDGALTQAEVREARSSAYMLDEDDDEMLTLDELGAGKSGAERVRTRRGNGEVFSLALLLIPLGDASMIDAAVRKLVPIYDKFAKNAGAKNSSKDGRLTLEEIGLEKSAFTAADQTADGYLDRAELTALLQNAEPQLELLVQMESAPEGIAKFRMLSDRRRMPPAANARNDATRGPVLQLDDIALELGGRGDDKRRVDVMTLYESRFSRADSDKNGYLAVDEYRSLGIPQQAFGVIDRDNDQKIFLEELLEFVKRQLTLARSRVTMTVSNQSKTMFEMVDLDYDQRLSMREYSTVADRLELWDADNDGRVVALELPHGVQASFDVGQPTIFSKTPLLPEDYEATRAMRPDIGSTWFTRMDRNRDGDVSRREFLGSLESFDKLDANHDGLIGRAEAEGK